MERWSVRKCALPAMHWVLSGLLQSHVVGKPIHTFRFVIPNSFSFFSFYPWPYEHDFLAVTVARSGAWLVGKREHFASGISHVALSGHIVQKVTNLLRKDSKLLRETIHFSEYWDRSKDETSSDRLSGDFSAIMRLRLGVFRCGSLSFVNLYLSGPVKSFR